MLVASLYHMRSTLVIDIVVCFSPVLVVLLSNWTEDSSAQDSNFADCRQHMKHGSASSFSL